MAAAGVVAQETEEVVVVFGGDGAGCGHGVECVDGVFPDGTARAKRRGVCEGRSKGFGTASGVTGRIGQFGGANR